MQNTTLCYIVRDGRYLMLHRMKKDRDVNRDKWVAMGGHFEENESPEDCVCREVLEETGLTLTDYRYCGIITFVSDRWEGEYMHLFRAEGFTGNLRDCDEGTLEWITGAQINNLPQWEGDRIFFRLMEENVPFFSLKLRYEGETLREAVLNGKQLPVGNVQSWGTIMPRAAGTIVPPPQGEEAQG